MNEPRKHHYIPQFYLKSWAGSDGRVVCYKRIPTGEIIQERVTPKATGYQKDLYTLEHLPEHLRQAIEKDVTADVDNRAAIALQKMIAKKSVATLTDEDRLAWAQFIVSLPIRNPEAVADIKETSTRSTMERAYEQAARRFPDWAEGDEFRTTFEESVNEGALTRFLSDNCGLMVICGLMLNPQFHKVILMMNWWVMMISGFSLLTCDRPYMIFPAMAHPRCLMYLPISPNLGFFASPDRLKERQIGAQNGRSVAKVMNRRLAVLAERFIYAADTQHTPLAEKFLGQP